MNGKASKLAIIWTCTLNSDGKHNICRHELIRFRKGLGISQRELADGLQDYNVDIGKNAVQQIEAGERFVTDIELVALAAYFRVTTDSLLGYTIPTE